MLQFVGVRAFRSGFRGRLGGRKRRWLYYRSRGGGCRLGRLLLLQRLHRLARVIDGVRVLGYRRPAHHHCQCHNACRQLHMRVPTSSQRAFRVFRRLPRKVLNRY